MQNTVVRQTKNQPFYFRTTVSESSSPQRKKNPKNNKQTNKHKTKQNKKNQLNCGDTRIITWNKEHVCMQTTQLICQAHLCKGQNTKTLQVLDQMKKGHKPTSYSFKKINFHQNQKRNFFKCLLNFPFFSAILYSVLTLHWQVQSA